MNAFERMISQLKPIWLYRLDGNSLVEAELQAYGVIMDQLSKDIYQNLKEAFLDEVDATSAERFERLFGLPKTEFPLTEERRKEREKKIKMMKDRLKIQNCDFTIDRLKDAVSTGGLKVEFEEDFENKAITVAVIEDENMFSTKEEKIEFIKKLMPCHSKVEVVFLTGESNN